MGSDGTIDGEKDQRNMGLKTQVFVTRYKLKLIKGHSGKSTRAVNEHTLLTQLHQGLDSCQTWDLNLNTMIFF